MSIKNWRIYLFLGLSIFALTLSVGFLIFKNYQGTNLNEPISHTYRSDEMVYLKTYYLLSKNDNFYFSHKLAAEERNPKLVLTRDVYTWRLPTIFYIWSLFAHNGYQILILYWELALIFLISCFYLVKKVANPLAAIISILLVIPYLAGNLVYKTSFLFIEWWGMFFFIIGLNLFLYKRMKWAFVFLILSVFTRELLIIPIILFFTYSIFLRRNRIFFLSIIVAFLLFYCFHYYEVIVNTSISGVSTPFSRIHFPDKLSFLTMTAFSMQKYPLIQLRINLVFIVLSLVGFVKYIADNKRRFSQVIYLYIYSWSLLLITPFITTSAYNDYWGILFMPAVLLTIPMAFIKALRKP